MNSDSQYHQVEITTQGQAITNYLPNLGIISHQKSKTNNPDNKKPNDKLFSMIIKITFGFDLIIKNKNKN